MEKIVILGAGGLAREALEVIKQANRETKTSKREILGFIDEDPKKRGVLLNGYPVLGDFDWFSTTDTTDIRAVCAIGNNEAREKVTKKAENLGIKFTNVVHPNVQMSEFVKLGKGVIICAGNIITCNIEIGNHVFINLDCTIGHDTILEDYVNLAPGAHISGDCRLLEGSHIFTGAVIIPGVTVGKWSVIGAGAVVLESIPDYTVAVGVPAKVIKQRK